MIIVLNSVAFRAAFILPDRVFQSILPLNDKEYCPYEGVFTFGIWRRCFILKSKLISLVAENSVKTTGLM